MPAWLYYAIPAGLLAGMVVTFFWGLAEAASRADDALEAEREHAMTNVARLPEPQLAEVLHFPRERRRSHVRNGIGGPAA